MGLKVRRVVTGHDEKGRAKVDIDEVATNIVRKRPGYESCVIWATESFPADLNDPTDGATRQVPTSVPNGTVFRVVRYEPGVAPRVHRTDSLDYAIILQGEIHLELEKGDEVLLKAGDVVVQRGTVHKWHRALRDRLRADECHAAGGRQGCFRLAIPSVARMISILNVGAHAIQQDSLAASSS